MSPVSAQKPEETAARYDFLKGVLLFAGLDDKALVSLAEAFEDQSCADGERIVAQGDYGDNLYLVRHGSAAAETGDGYERTALALFRQGDFFGELALFDREPRSATVRAISPCQILRLGRSQFLTLVESHPQVLWNICQEFARRIRATSQLAHLKSTAGKLIASRDV